MSGPPEERPSQVEPSQATIQAMINEAVTTTVAAQLEKFSAILESRDAAASGPPGTG